MIWACQQAPQSALYFNVHVFFSLPTKKWHFLFLIHWLFLLCLCVREQTLVSLASSLFFLCRVPFCLFPGAASLVFTLLASSILIVPMETGSLAASLSYSRPWPRSWRQTLLCMCYVNGSARGCSSIHLSPLSPICPLRIMVSSSPTRLYGLWMTQMSTEWLSTRWELEAM